MRRVLITGGTGLLGLNWAAVIRSTAKVFIGVHKRKVSLAGVESVPVDLRTVESFSANLRATKPDLVVHAAGLASVEKCEVSPDDAYYQNVYLSENVAKSCALAGAKLIHISSDHLFSGSYPCTTEDVRPAPVKIYAKTKAFAEERVLALITDPLIIRTNFFCWGTSYRQSISDIIIGALMKGEKITLFSDVYFTPIIAEAAVLKAMHLSANNITGILHVAGASRLSKFDFGVALARRFGFDEKLIQHGEYEARSDLVRRPLDMSLSTAKPHPLPDDVPHSLAWGIDRLCEQEKEGLRWELGNL